MCVYKMKFYLKLQRKKINQLKRKYHMTSLMQDLNLNYVKYLCMLAMKVKSTMGERSLQGGRREAREGNTIYM